MNIDPFFESFKRADLRLFRSFDLFSEGYFVSKIFIDMDLRDQVFYAYHLDVINCKTEGFLRLEFFRLAEDKLADCS